MVMVSLFVRLWVEILGRLYMSLELGSASSWGCELKYESQHWRRKSHCCQPLREAVSWNTLKSRTIEQIAVSLFVRLWVEMTITFSDGDSENVSLFVRLWVEISADEDLTKMLAVSLFVRLWVEILVDVDDIQRQMKLASSWGCELKWENVCHVICGCGQPLREAVSWNNGVQQAINADTVSASSWGCELKLDMYLT